MNKENKKKKENQGLVWPELIPGRLIKRYKRFITKRSWINGWIFWRSLEN